MKVWVLGSGSRGNAVVVESGESRLMIDCGFGPTVLERRLEQVPGTDEIRLHEGLGPIDRTIDVTFGRQVHDGVRRVLGKDLAQ